MNVQPTLLGPELSTQLGAEQPDEQLVKNVLSGDPRWFEVLMRRHNARLFRVARAILKDDGLAEDVMQETYLRAFRSLHQFEARSSLATWLTRIAIHEAIARRRKLQREAASGGVGDLVGHDAATTRNDPEIAAQRGELLRTLTRLVDALPTGLREVFVLRAVEGMSGAEVAEALDISEENVKVRLFRARAALRAGLNGAADDAIGDLFDFHLVRCDRVVLAVLRGLAAGGIEIAWDVVPSSPGAVEVLA